MNRTIALGVAWTASAAAAVGLGFLAVSLVDASASPGTNPGAARTTSTAPSATPTAPVTGATSGEYVTVGGTVFASCTAGVPSLAGAPAPGWWVDDSNDPGEVKFENGTQKIEVHTACVGDVPQFSDEGLRSDDGDSPAPTPSAPSSSDDSSGHGSDDSGDDSSGRDGGGHGSDD